MTEIVLAVDGGNSKTHLALLDRDGAVLSLVRGPASKPQKTGVEICVDMLADLRLKAVAAAGLDEDVVAEAAHMMIAGVDLEDEELAFHDEVFRRGWARSVYVGNDTFALLRAGSDRGWGVAVVCGAGINCVGRTREGEETRFLALGPTTGDWGGGTDIGKSALSAAARSEDGRGPTTALEKLVAEHFGFERPLEVALALHHGEMPEVALVKLAPVVFAASAYDEVAAELVRRQADEVIAFARVALDRLDMRDDEPDVVLGGGILASGFTPLLDRVNAGIVEVCPKANIRICSSPPIVGAALLALTEVGADDSALHRARAELTDVVLQVQAAQA